MPVPNPSSPSKPGRFDSLISQIESTIAKALAPPPPGAGPSLTAPAMANPAVARCVQAYNSAYDASLQEPENNHRDAERAGKLAYRQSLPPLIGRRNIRDFTACIAHGMLLQVIDTVEGTRILYAAQVAANTRNTQPARTQKKTQKSTEKRDKNNVPAPPFGEQPIQNE